jgi:hypothetical protein
MIKCEEFKVTVLVDSEDVLTLQVMSDLPRATGVTLHVHRTYRDKRDEESLWTMYLNRHALDSDLGQLLVRVSVVDGDKRAASEYENYYKRAGMLSPPTSTIFVYAVVGARQRHRGFGPQNRHLHGARVQESGGVKIVEATAQVDVPMVGRRSSDLN